MDRRYANAATPDDLPETSAGKLIVNKLYYYTLHMGTNNLVRLGDVAVPDPQARRAPMASSASFWRPGWAPIKCWSRTS